MDSTTVTLAPWEDLTVDINFDGDDESSDSEYTIFESDDEGNQSSDTSVYSGADTGSQLWPSDYDYDSDSEYSSSEDSGDTSDDEPSPPSGPGSEDSDSDSDTDSNNSDGSIGTNASTYFFVWPGSDPAEVKVDKLKSHRYMRTTAVTHLPTGERRIVRSPWWTSDAVRSVKQELDHIQFLKRHTNLPAASVVIASLNPDSCLGRPYIVTEAIPGQILSEVYQDLSHQVKCRIAKEVGDMYRHMLEVQFPVPGDIMLDDITNEVVVAPFTVQQVVEDATPRPSQRYANEGLYPAFSKPEEVWPADTVFEVMDCLFKKWRAVRRGDPNDSDYDEVDAEVKLEWISRPHYQAYDMNTRFRLFDGVPFTLCNGGFDWDAVVVDPSRVHEPAEVAGLITAISDLPALEFAPAFNQCKPPVRLWNPEYENEEGLPWVRIEDAVANCRAEPSTEEGKEIKAIFDEAAGDVYRRFAYDPIYVMARRLWRFAFENFASYSCINESERMLRMWKVMRRNGTVGQPTEQTDE
ncbi:hypothetical protein QBC43DRAFT_67587 [Cladorrhinum sp. PSN259]|nr:hypothetical protein QBC43DRAFT_67587 [Cladorrhinum sp. PSN259]